ncbi:hypothetical protein D9757_009555 [Collybiopsis confluens]|uniref:DUF6535 domain-containing protein n=1 Tax=Collybiopsis confluens TaxID=2823264 RepID=A0A8H5H8I7_9AGAR|nr:hypothetical protein D9757_009555 [Collybiopsis confluens]
MVSIVELEKPGITLFTNSEMLVPSTSSHSSPCSCAILHFTTAQIPFLNQLECQIRTLKVDWDEFVPLTSLKVPGINCGTLESTVGTVGGLWLKRHIKWTTGPSNSFYAPGQLSLCSLDALLSFFCPRSAHVYDIFTSATPLASEVSRESRDGACENILNSRGTVRKDSHQNSCRVAVNALFVWGPTTSPGPEFCIWRTLKTLKVATEVKKQPPIHVHPSLRRVFAFRRNGLQVPTHDVLDQNDDYEQRFPEDPQFEETVENARVWRTYLAESAAFDENMLGETRDGLDVMPVAGLFSAVITSFLVQTSQNLQLSSSDVSASLLFELIAVQRAAAAGINVTSVPASPLTPSASLVAAVL